MSPLILLSQDNIGDFLNLLPIFREYIRKTDPCPGSFASQRDPSERYIGTMVDIGSAPHPGLVNRDDPRNDPPDDATAIKD